MSSIIQAWNESAARRMQKGGDLYRRPLSRGEMTAPLAWHEAQLADGTIGYEIVGGAA